MTLEQQVSNLELSKKLCELGVKQESLFYWKPSKGKHICHSKKSDHVHDYKWQLCKFQFLDKKGNSTEEKKYFEILEKMNLLYSAFTVAELGELLTGNDGQRYFYSYPSKAGWSCKDYDLGHTTSAEIEADARAKMLIYLLENKLVIL